jgi:hypothetical protein
MATDQVRVKPAAPKYEAVVEKHLGRALSRIRLLDMAAAALLLASATLLYVLAMILLDRALELSATARQTAFLGYALGLAVFVGVAVVWPLCCRINPYFAARRLEATLPEAKNSLVNWLDLRHQPLPPAIRGAVGHRAAEDARHVDLETAISSRLTAWFGGITGALALILFVAMLVFGPPQFFSLLGRTFWPFGGGVIKSQTTLEIMEPRGGDAIVPIGQPLNFAVHVGGKVPAANGPNAVKLLFRHRQTDPYEERPMECEQDREYATVLPAFQVQSGLWYKIVGGDAETKEYQVTVRSNPLVERIDVTYHFRPYLCWRDEESREPNLKALRGTEVTLIARTNRQVRDGRLVLDLKNGQQTLTGERVDRDAQALRFKFVLDQDGQYRISFTSADGDSNVESAAYTISVVRDYPPRVELTKPGQDVALPANGLLQLEGSASDDVGVKSMTLRMRVVDGAALKSKPYRPEKEFKLADGSYPKMLEYKDAVELDKVKDEQDKPFALQPKMIVEYWLEAADNCDYPPPGPNIGESKHFHVTIGEPEKDAAKLAQQRSQAAADQKKHEQAQNEKLDKENEAIKNQPKDSDSNPDQAPNAEERKKIDDTESKVQNALDQQERNQTPEAGDSKPDDQKQPGETKDDGKKDQQADAGQGKDKGAPDAKQEPGQDKGEGAMRGDKPPQRGEDKNQGKGAQDQPKGAGKEESGGKDGAGEAKDQGGAQSGSDKGGGKDAGNGANSKPDAAKDKGAGADDGGKLADKGDAKSVGKDGKASDQKPAGDAKPENHEIAKAEGKEGGKADDGAQGQAKDAAGRTTGGDMASDKSAGAETADTKSKSKGEAKAGPRKPASQASENDDKPGQHAKPDDVAKAAKGLESKEPSKLEEAAHKLAQMAQNGQDPKAKEAARDALEKAFRDPKTGEPNPAAAKTGPKPEGQPKPDSSQAAESKKPGAADAQQGSPKKEGGAEGGPAKAESKGRPTNPGGMGEEHGKGDPTGEAKGKAPGKGSQANIDGSGGSGHTDKGQNGRDSTHKGGPGDERDRKKAGELLLRRFDKVVDKKKFLQENGITEEQMRKLRDDIAKRGQRPTETGDDRRPKRGPGGGTLTDQGVRRVQPGGPNRAGDDKYGGLGKPPAEFRDLVNEFTSTVSQPERAKDKK